MARSSTSYPRKWNSGRTTVIRVPEKFSNQLMRIAQFIDSGDGFEIHEDGATFTLELKTHKTKAYSSRKPVNVASVPQRSPFRYPGGKTWLIPYIRTWLSSKNELPSRFIEPFAGGGAVSLTAGFEKLAKSIIMVEKDPGVAAVWKIILNGQSEWLERQILEFDLNEDNARQVLSTMAGNLRECAFQTILRNRVQRGGIMAPGAGLVKTGENGRGIRSRWYPQTLARRIREINYLKDRFNFIEGDAFDIIREHQEDEDACFYIDPPYTVAAKRLYVAWQIDHENLFAEISRCRGDFLMSYDNTREITQLAKKFGFVAKPVAMKSTHHTKMTELLIGRNLDWLKN